MKKTVWQTKTKAKPYQQHHYGVERGGGGDGNTDDALVQNLATARTSLSCQYI